MTHSYQRLNPFSSYIKNRYPLTKPQSSQEVYHIVLHLPHDKLTFKVGDALGIYGENDPILVDRLLKMLRQDGNVSVFSNRLQASFSLREFLSQKANINRLTSAFLQLLPHHPKTQALLNNQETLKSYLNQHEPLDFFEEFSQEGIIDIPIERLVNAFSPLLPRFYSAASSTLTHPNEIHLTVSVSIYQHKNQTRYGVVSHFLSHLAQIQQTPIPCYVQTTPHFTLPLDTSKNIIMVGPGTGIAPFRGFLQERVYKNGLGKNWLFFGNRESLYDFLYQSELHEWVKEKKLILNTAFSRDQATKIYVQHKLYENGKDIWDWVQEGAYVYICGEADPMSKEVEAMFLLILQKFGNLTIDESKHYLLLMKKEKRYLCDVY